MSAIQSQIFQNLGDVLTGMARYAGGSIPASNSTAYTDWVTWIQASQDDAAKRGFWGRLLKKATIIITADVDYAVLPADFHKRNGIYVLNVGGEDWNSMGMDVNPSQQRLMVSLEYVPAVAPETVDSTRWVVRFNGFTPTATTTGTLWYFAAPTVPEDETDPLMLDGEMVMFGALKEYFRQARQPGSQDDARLEYENRFNENLNLEMLPSPQEIMSWGSVYDHKGISPMDEVHRSSANKTKYHN